ncbi:heterokaryon incompatibility protein-domain-containing protein [Apiospora saccharicola]
MWFINVESMKPEEFADHESPIYSVLSCTSAVVRNHQEVEFEERGLGNMIWQGEYGESMVRSFCQRTKDRGIKYAWIDAYCIGQSLDMEFPKAIDAMYGMYQNAALWCVYLHESSELEEWLLQSWWFTGLWTLQEATAPPKVLFYDQDWFIIGETLCDLILGSISKITHTCENALHDGDHVYDPTIIDPHFLTPEGETSSKEDCTYCLLEHYGSKIPVLDKEVCSAFRHLETEIIKLSIDKPPVTSPSTAVHRENARYLPQGTPSDNVPFSGESHFLQPFSSSHSRTLPDMGLQNTASLFDRRSFSNLAWGLTDKAQAKLSHVLWADAFGISKSTFVRPRSLEISKAKNVFSSPLAVNSPMYDRHLLTPWLSSAPRMSNLETLQLAEDASRNRVLHGADEALMSKRTYLWSKWILDNILLAKSESNHILAQDVESPKSDPGPISKLRGPDTKTVFCANTSHLESVADIDTGDSDGFSISGSEEDDMSIPPARERFSWILKDLVENSMRLFFQTLVYELLGPWKVVQLSLSAPRAEVQEDTRSTQWESFSWLLPDHEISGNLWIKGKPGCSKSGLMTRSHGQIEAPRTIRNNEDTIWNSGL